MDCYKEYSSMVNLLNAVGIFRSYIIDKVDPNLIVKFNSNIVIDEG